MFQHFSIALRQSVRKLFPRRVQELQLSVCCAAAGGERLKRGRHRACIFGQFCISPFYASRVFLCELFQVDERVLSATNRAQELINLELQGCAVAILCVLCEK